MKKYKVFITLMIIGFIFVIPFNAKAERNVGKDVGRSETIEDKMYAAFASDGYLGLAKAHYYVKWLQDSGGHQAPWIAYCYDFNTPFIYRTDFEKKGAADVGVQYIIKNGFTGSDQSYHPSAYNGSVPSTITNSPKANSPWYVNYWLTQVAIWIYQGTVPGFSGNLSGNKKIIQDLVNGAREVKKSSTNFANVDPKMTIGNTTLKIDGEYYYSEIITATGVGEKFTVSVDDKNYEVVNSSKKAQTSFKNGDKFYIRIAKSKVTKDGQVTVTLSTTAKTYAVRYASNQRTQDLVHYRVEDVKTKTTTLKLNVEYACELVVKIVDSETNEKVCGGTVTILDENGNVAKDTKGVELKDVAISDDKCEAAVLLPWGNYRVVQQTAKDPYLKDSEEHKIVASTECPLNVTLKNEKLYQIRILKIDGSEDNPVAGAKLKFEDSNGNVIKEFVSTSEAITIDKLHKGTYYLSEISAPKGYSLSSEKITIEVNNDNNNKLFTYNNDEIIVPKTDFNSGLMIFSLIAGVIGIGLIWYSKKQRYA